MEREVYIITRDEFREDGNDFTTLCIHETLTGAVLHLNELVIKERDEYMEDLEKEDVEESWHKDPDGTMSWHIWQPCGYDELYLHIFRKELLD